MVRVYRRKTGQQQWSKISMCRAIEAVQNKTMTSSVAAIKFNVPRTTLIRRSKNTEADKNTLQNIKLGRFTATFSEDQEKKLAEFLLEMDKRFFGLTPIEFRRLAFQFAEANQIPHRFNKEKGVAGQDWYQNFLRRHQNLSLRSPENTSFARACGFNKVNVDKFFDLLTSLMEKYNFSPSRIFNVDETGITTVPNQAPKVLSVRGKRQVGAISSGERGTTVTAVICCNAAGTFIPPLMIFPRKRSHPEFQEGCPPETQLVFHSSGWMQKEIFCPTWFNHFKKYARPQADDPVLLILDGHVTHVKNLDLIKSAKESHVHILCLPPHTTHKTQPLDRCFMNPLKTYYSQHCSTWLRNHPGQVITLRNVGKIFGEAYMRAAVPQNAISGFKACGICPLNRYIFPDEEYDPATTTDIDLETAANIEDEPLSIVPVNEIGSQFKPTEGQEVVSKTLVRIKDNNCAAVRKIPATKAALRNKASVNESSSINKENVCSNLPLKALEPNLSLQPLSSTVNQSEVEPQDLIPIPRVSYVSRTRKHSKNKGKTVIVTSSPYAKSLEEKQHEEDSKVIKKLKTIKKELFSSRDTRKTPKKQRTGKKVTQVKDDDAACMFCDGVFSQSKPGEKWIQCQRCKKWAHEKCTSLPKRSRGRVSFVCDFCAKPLDE